MVPLKCLVAAVALGAALLLAPSAVDARVTTHAASAHRSSTLPIKHKKHRRLHRRHGVRHTALHVKTTKSTAPHTKSTKTVALHAKPITHVNVTTARRHHAP